MKVPISVSVLDGRLARGADSENPRWTNDRKIPMYRRLVVLEPVPRGCKEYEMGRIRWTAHLGRTALG